MGLNEEIDLDTYNDDTPIISNMERVGVKDGIVTISMVLNVFVDNDNDYSKNTMGKVGDIAKIKVVTEWSPRKVAVKTRGPRSRNADEFLHHVVSIESDIQIPKQYERLIRNMFSVGINSERLISGIYYPYIKHVEKNVNNDQAEKSRTIRDEDNRKLWMLINNFDEIKQPKKQEDNQPKKETPKDVFGNMWTSTSTWDVKK